MIINGDYGLDTSRSGGVVGLKIHAVPTLVVTVVS